MFWPLIVAPNESAFLNDRSPNWAFVGLARVSYTATSARTARRMPAASFAQPLKPCCWFRCVNRLIIGARATSVRRLGRDRTTPASTRRRMQGGRHTTRSRGARRPCGPPTILPDLLGRSSHRRLATAAASFPVASTPIGAACLSSMASRSSAAEAHRETGPLTWVDRTIRSFPLIHACVFCGGPWRRRVAVRLPLVAASDRRAPVGRRD